MEWLNYHHLYYFWVVAKQGSIARAVDELRLSQPTISGQLKLLEDSLGEKLFTRAGRGLALTEVGQLTYRYADEIFSVGREFQDVLKGRPAGRPVPLRVGVSDLVPKLIAYRILQPAQVGLHRGHIGRGRTHTWGLPAFRFMTSKSRTGSGGENENDFLTAALAPTLRRRNGPGRF